MAEEILELVERRQNGPEPDAELSALNLAEALVHATLAQVGATIDAVGYDVNAPARPEQWAEVLR